jgi:cytoskeletal protein RodZ
MKNMQQKSTKINKTPFIIVLCFLIIALYGFSAYAFKFWPFNRTTVLSTNNKSGDLQQNNPKTNIPAASDNTSKTTNQVPVDSALVATIDRLDQTNGVVTFQGSVNSPLPGGNCSIIFTNPNDKPVTQTANATLSNGMAKCGPIQIPEQQFTYLGEWNATFRYYINGSQVVTIKAITIK